MKRKRLEILYKPAKKIMKKIPRSLRFRCLNKIKKTLKNQFPEGDEWLEQKAEDFLLIEISILFWGIFLISFLALSLFLSRYIASTDVTIQRNAFGYGTKEVPLLLKDGEEEESYSVILEEQELSSEEIENIYQEFFMALSEHMAGDNESLLEVNTALCFDSSLEGYPFQIVYQPENLEYINLDGSIGDAQDKIGEEDILSTTVAVTASYEKYTKSKVYDIHLIPKMSQEQDDDPFSGVIDMLEEMEKKTRKDEIYTVPDSFGDVQIKNKEEKASGKGILFIAASAIVLLCIHKYFLLKEAEKQCRRETVQDFSMIVHLLTLYMGAGLSFSSAIQRISEDYQNRMGKQKKRYAFEKIVQMNGQMRMGVSQKEACINWGKEFEENIYQKLSMTLTQVISKGAREARVLMAAAELEAFRQRVAQAKQAGEEASTKLLFPMIVLMCLVMVIVMFPAMMRFRGF